jgi:HK97 gp10 family phage protein
LAKVIGVDRAIKKLEKYINSKHPQLVATVGHSSNNIKSESRTLAPKDLGELRNSIDYVVKDRKKSIDGEISANKDYAQYVEFGTSPHFPPISALEGWAERHGISPYAVAKSIARKGTTAQPFMSPALRKEKPNFIQAVERVMKYP